MRAYWAAEDILQAISDWEVVHGEPPTEVDWNPWYAKRLNRPEIAEQFELANGVWPSYQTVIRRFGSWNAAIVAGGFAPRAAHGGAGNSRRGRRLSRAA